MAGTREMSLLRTWCLAWPLAETAVQILCGSPLPSPLPAVPAPASPAVAVPQRGEARNFTPQSQEELPESQRNRAAAAVPYRQSMSS